MRTAYILTYLMCIVFMSVNAQKGIHFENNLNWQQLLKKAKKENRFIFIDCFATWCAPCKKMDREVFPNDTLGGFMNEKFISIKIQMDTAKDDNEETKATYATAHSLMQENGVNAFPTYLFFSADGKLVHRGTGYQKTTDFISLVKDASDPNRQYYTLMDNYLSGKRDYANMIYLSQKAKETGNNDFSVKIANDYIHNYLEKLDEVEIFQKANLNFINSHVNLISSKDKIFPLFRLKAITIDSIIKRTGYAIDLVRGVINNEEIIPIISQAQKDNLSEPDWKMISDIISEKYGKNYINPNLINAEIRWYRNKKNWSKYSYYLVKSIDDAGIENFKGVNGLVILNNAAFDVFKYSMNKSELKKAIFWTDHAITLMPTFPNTLDTKANLLYKLGRKSEAIQLEEKAITLAPQDKEIQSAYSKMKKGIPTWISPENLK